MFLSSDIHSWPLHSVVYSIPYLLLGLIIILIGYSQVFGDVYEIIKIRFVRQFKKGYIENNRFVRVLSLVKTSHSKQLSLWQATILFLILLLFFGLRWHILSDTLAYEKEFYTFTDSITCIFSIPRDIDGI